MVLGTKTLGISVTTSEIILYGAELSGHTHRVELLLRMLGLPYRFKAASAEVRRTAEFHRLNPLGQIPVLQDGDVTLADSNAILVYLAKRYGGETHWLPDEPEAAARVQRWLSIAAGEVRYGPAMARMITQWNFPGSLADSKQIAGVLLRFMDEHLNWPHVSGGRSCQHRRSCLLFLRRACARGRYCARRPCVGARLASPRRGVASFQADSDRRRYPRELEQPNGRIAVQCR